ncbi:tripartite tricarboxylate transporter TctB family protein [Cupriavidus sp. amp6]|uniref:tripartite tricarboxylate transporter TctB family protein n=1 Tax=Cupriavidus sp. amp6 TaxID=388051 RepID=UPI000491E55E|nr:tripartite tricarboxylate transporter TctB family protein [Cupriavidus sp. amp6]
MGRLKSNQNFLSGLLLVSLAALFGFLGRNLKFGTPSQMGPGFAPLLLSCLLGVIGVILLIRATRDHTTPDDWPAGRVLLIVCAAPLVFGALLRPTGLIVAVVVTSLVARLAMPGKIGWADLIAAVLLAVFCAVTFVVLLGQSMPLWSEYV